MVLAVFFFLYSANVNVVDAAAEAAEAAGPDGKSMAADVCCCCAGAGKICGLLP